MNLLTKSDRPGAKLRVFSWAALLLFVLTGQARAQTVDTTSLNNKVMAGYQGWHRAPGDLPGYNGWGHWFRGAPSVRGLGFDTWPDVSELTPEEKHAVPGFFHADGSPAYLYSALNYQTVLRHFQWMQTAGIDGVWLSQFCNHFPGGSQAGDYVAVTNIMNNVQQAAAATGRTWAFMYDMSGLNINNTASIISNQWVRMVDTGVTADPRYLHHEGKPVLLIWGFFPNRPQSTPRFTVPLVKFLESPGPYQAALVGGGDPFIRTSGSEEFKAMLMTMTAWMPWQVGRGTNDPVTGFRAANTAHWAADAAMCATNHVLYIPVVYGGTAVAGPPPVPPALPAIPRRGGNTLWEQFAAASKIPTINSVFVAMFDEVNEGTQIMKIESHPPTNTTFLTYEGATSDYYMKLVVLGESMLREHKPIKLPIPISPFDPNLTYKIVNRASGGALSSSDGTAGAPITASRISNLPPRGTGGFRLIYREANESWQLSYDGAGYFSLKNKGSGKYLNQGGPGPNQDSLVQSDNVASDSAKWELVWDGTGYCKIRAKGSAKVLSGGDATADEYPVLQVADAAAEAYQRSVAAGTNAPNARTTVVVSPAYDNLRWKIVAAN